MGLVSQRLSRTANVGQALALRVFTCCYVAAPLLSLQVDVVGIVPWGVVMHRTHLANLHLVDEAPRTRSHSAFGFSSSRKSGVGAFLGGFMCAPLSVRPHAA